jgi:hypothetical protein
MRASRFLLLALLAASAMACEAVLGLGDLHDRAATEPDGSAGGDASVGDGGGGPPDGSMSPDAGPNVDGSTPHPDAGPPVFVDLTNNKMTGDAPVALVDSAGQKLLVVGTTITGRVGLTRCNLDGSSCAYVDISAGQLSGINPAAVIDTVNKELVVVATSSADALGIYRCNVDGTSCVFKDISLGTTIYAPSIALDAQNNKILVVGSDATNGHPLVYRMGADLSGETLTDVSAGQGDSSGIAPTILVDAVNQKLLVVAQNNANNGKPSLFRCNLDATGCLHSDLSAMQEKNSGYAATAVIDPTNKRLLVVTADLANSTNLALFRCALDGTACAYFEIAHGADAGVGYEPSIVIDPIYQRLLVVTTDDSRGDRASLFRCTLDGTTCTFADVSAGQDAGTGYSPSAVVDVGNKKLLVVTDNYATGHNPGLYIMGL